MRSEAAKALLSTEMRGFVQGTLETSGLDGSLSELLATKSFAEAAAIAEQQMATEDGSKQAKLAWVLSHIHLGTLPVSALSAAFSEALKSVEKTPQISSTAILTTVLLVEKLCERGQLRLAASIINVFRSCDYGDPFKCCMIQS